MSELVPKGLKFYLVAEVTMPPYVFDGTTHDTYESATASIDEKDDGGNGNWAVFEAVEVEPRVAPRGSAGGAARAEALSGERRREIAQRAARARWGARKDGT